jgi:hypothetical protein
MNCHVIMSDYMDAYVDDDVDTTSAHLLTGQNLRWANFWPNLSQFHSSFLAILAIHFSNFAAQIHHQFLMYFSAHYYITYSPYTQPNFAHSAHIHSPYTLSIHLITAAAYQIKNIMFPSNIISHEFSSNI